MFDNNSILKFELYIKILNHLRLTIKQINTLFINESAAYK